MQTTTRARKCPTGVFHAFACAVPALTCLCVYACVRVCMRGQAELHAWLTRKYIILIHTYINTQGVLESGYRFDLYSGVLHQPPHQIKYRSQGGRPEGDGIRCPSNGLAGQMCCGTLPGVPEWRGEVLHEGHQAEVHQWMGAYVCVRICVWGGASSRSASMDGCVRVCVWASNRSASMDGCVCVCVRCAYVCVWWMGGGA
jgi:hypothetical protein